jgi:large subunit ribosomal protein L29
MKAGEIRDMSSSEIEMKIKDLKQELFNLRFQHNTGQLENTSRLSRTKKDIARLMTILKENENNTVNA